MKVAVYARLSQDRNGESTSTARQVRDCEAFAEAKGWQVVARYIDSDLSAYSDKITRPEFERLLEDVCDGEADVILSWKLDRLLRRPREMERVLDVCRASGASVATLKDSIDTAQDFGEVMPRMLSIFAELESKNISIRQRSKAAEIAKAGRHHGGGTRPFGLSADWARVLPTEAALIREAVSRVLDGDSLRGIAQDWNGRNITTTTGKTWKPEVLRQMLVSPRLAGLRTHHGVVVGEGAFPAIIDQDTHRRLEAVLRHGNGTRGPQARKYLLTGTLRCHACGKPMVGHRQPRETYICQPRPRGCGGTKIGAEPLEALVRDRVLDRLDSPEFAAALAAEEGRSQATIDLDQLRDDEQALDQLSRDHYVDRIIGRSEYMASRDALTKRIESARRKLARTGNGRRQSLVGLGEQLRAAWDAEPIDYRRSILAAVVDRITIGPAVRGRNTFDSSRVSIAWRV